MQVLNDDSLQILKMKIPLLLMGSLTPYSLHPKVIKADNDCLYVHKNISIALNLSVFFIAFHQQ